MFVCVFFSGLFPQPHDPHGFHASIFWESVSLHPTEERKILERAGEWSQIVGAEGQSVWYMLREPVKGNEPKKPRVRAGGKEETGCI